MAVYMYGGEPGQTKTLRGAFIGWIESDEDPGNRLAVFNRIVLISESELEEKTLEQISQFKQEPLPEKVQKVLKEVINGR